MREKTPVAVLISGRGSNMEALVRAAREKDFPARIVGVLSNRADAGGLVSARAAGIETVAISHRDFADRAAHDAAMSRAIADLGAELVCLAGYMRILTPQFVESWRGRMINIHPSLLPVFPGLHTHRRALEAGARIHGCTVHFVTEVMDEGPIIAQAAVPVLSGDDEDTLAARVLKAEHALYPMALKMVAEGRTRIDGNRVIVDGAGEDPAAMMISPAPGEDAPDVERLARMTP